MDKYPDFFKDVDEDGVELGDGTHSLVTQLYERNNYLNRPHKRKPDDEDSPGNPSKNHKGLTSARAGCHNWGPSTCTSYSNEEISNIQDISKTTKHGDSNYMEVLEKTYIQIRSFLNAQKVPTILQIKEEWPILFSSNAIFWHFEKLTGTNIHFLDQMKEKSAKILSSIKSKQENALLLYDNAEPELELLIRLSEHFKEDINSFYVENEVRIFLKFCYVFST